MATQPERPTRLVSETRLANAMAAFRRADTKDQLIEPKNKAKAMGLLPKDMARLKTEFEAAQARINEAKRKDRANEHRSN